ncbi:MAG: hypothetical protein H6Q93_87 [Nitrospirae bacterium]|nr:hypothetical protein [Nitrospirota bacterium]
MVRFKVLYPKYADIVAICEKKLYHVAISVLMISNVGHENIPAFESQMSYKGCVRTQADSPGRTDKDFSSHIPAFFSANAFFGFINKQRLIPLALRMMMTCCNGDAFNRKSPEEQYRLIRLSFLAIQRYIVMKYVQKYLLMYPDQETCLRRHNW